MQDTPELKANETDLLSDSQLSETAEPEVPCSGNFKIIEDFIIGFLIRNYLQRSCTEVCNSVLEIIQSESKHCLKYNEASKIKSVTFLSKDSSAIQDTVNNYDKLNTTNTFSFEAKFIEQDICSLGIQSSLSFNGVLIHNGLPSDSFTPTKLCQVIRHIYGQVYPMGVVLLGVIDEDYLDKMLKGPNEKIKNTCYLRLYEGDEKRLKHVSIDLFDVPYNLQLWLVSSPIIISLFEKCKFKFEKKLNYLECFEYAMSYKEERELFLKTYSNLTEDFVYNPSLTEPEEQIANMLSFYVFSK